jgi:hypothetical protein
MATSVEVFALTDICATPKATGLTVQNGDRLEVYCDVADTWDLDKTGDPSKTCNADGAAVFGLFYIACDGLSELNGSMCAKAGSKYFKVGTSYNQIVSGVSGSQALYLYIHDVPTEDNRGSIIALVTVTPAMQQANDKIFIFSGGLA